MLVAKPMQTTSTNTDILITSISELLFIAPLPVGNVSPVVVPAVMPASDDWETQQGPVTAFPGYPHAPQRKPITKHQATMSKPGQVDPATLLAEEKERRLAEERAIAALKLQRKQRLQAMSIKRQRNLDYLKVQFGHHRHS
jgi:hypothetical protein